MLRVSISNRYRPHWPRRQRDSNGVDVPVTGFRAHIFSDLLVGISCTAGDDSAAVLSVNAGW
jgi:hypothetical protein